MIEASPGCVVGAYQALLQLLLVSLDVFSQLCLRRKSLSAVLLDVAFVSFLQKDPLDQAGAVKDIGGSIDYQYAISICFQTYRKLLFKIKAAALSNSSLLLVVPAHTD